MCRLSFERNEPRRGFSFKTDCFEAGCRSEKYTGNEKLTKEVMTVIPDNYLLKEEDELVCYGLYKDFQALWKAF